MGALTIVILLVVAFFSFLGGFLLGINFKKAYLRADALPFSEPKQEQGKGCGKRDRDCDG